MHAHCDVQIGNGYRLFSFFAHFDENSGRAALTLIMIDTDKNISAARSYLDKDAKHFQSFTTNYPAFHIFEREIFENTRILAVGNPWLKPVRYPVDSKYGIDDYPFFKIEGKEVHEVGVGPIHAGVIEPGHFRFMCFGEKVHHLEIQLGYQHRGIEKQLLRGNPRRLSPIVESIAGDSAISHALPYCLALEGLAQQHSVSPSVNKIRLIALELERIAMHLASLSGLANDIAYLPGAATYGRLRTAVINLSMRICGSRFGKSWIRPGGIAFGIDKRQSVDIIETLTKLKSDFLIINSCFFTSRSVLTRLAQIGILSQETARQIGVVGMIARSSGINIDLRSDFLPSSESSAKAGDCLARTLIRSEEIIQSIDWVISALKDFDDVKGKICDLPAFLPNSLAISAVEGWRGEVVHCLETDKNYNVTNYRVQDPSLRNWFGLALAVRNNAISDFPICNKSFDLSYCGNDL